MREKRRGQVGVVQREVAGTGEKRRIHVIDVAVGWVRQAKARDNLASVRQAKARDNLASMEVTRVRRKGASYCAEPQTVALRLLSFHLFWMSNLTTVWQVFGRTGQGLAQEESHAGDVLSFPPPSLRRCGKPHVT